MLRILSEKESKKIERETDRWFKNLDSNTKSRIRHLIEPMLKVMECSHHDMVDCDTYENEFESGESYCKDCGVHFKSDGTISYY